jgi:hypothetical protein
MVLILHISVNNSVIRRYLIQRITNTSMLKPTGTKNRYKVTCGETQKHIGYVSHNFDDPPEKLVIKAMKLVIK